MLVFFFFFFCFVSHLLVHHHLDQIYEDSIQELNNLIGELDSFQKEHELSLLQKNGNASLNNGTLEADCNYDRISIGSSNIGSLGYSIPSNTSSECKFNYSTVDVQRYFNESSSGFDSTDSTNNEIIHIHENDSELYVKENTEIVVLRRKDSTNDLNKIIDVGTAITAIGSGNQQQQTQQQRFSSFKSDLSTTARLSDSSMNNSTLRIEQTDGGTQMSALHLNDFKMSLEERLRSKPIISPRPASLSGLFHFFFIYFFILFFISV